MTISLLGAWLEGSMHVTEAGANRMFVVVLPIEGSGSVDHRPSAITYGGQGLTQRVAISRAVGSLFTRVELWTLMEAGIALGADDNVIITWTPNTPSGTRFHTFHGFYSGVNQVAPIVASDSATKGNSAGFITTADIATSASGYALQACSTPSENITYTHVNGFSEQISNVLGDGVVGGSVGGRSTAGAAVSPRIDFSFTGNMASSMVAISFAPDMISQGPTESAVYGAYLRRRRR